MRPLHWTIMATHVPAGGSLGGVVRYTTELISALAEREDVVVSAVTTRAAADTIAALIGDRARVSTVPNAPVPLLSIAERRAPLPGLRNGADVIQGTKQLVPARSNALRVLTIHDMLLLDRKEDFGRAKQLLLPAPYRGSIRDSDLLICVSEASRQRLAAHVPGAEKRAEVVHLATSSTLRNAVPRGIPALTGKTFALVVGDASPRKNLRTVVTAWASVRARCPDAVLAMVAPPNWGRTVVGDDYQGLVDSGAILALGQVDDAELRWAYEHAAVVLCPSLAEGFGLPAAEALDFGARVLISEDAALQEVSAGRARGVLPPLDVQAWSDGIVAVLEGPPRPGTNGTANPPVSRTISRTWDDVAADTVRAVTATRAAMSNDHR
ncbi:MAG: glycosyl transferase group 1 [Pseudonocardiales bacterium]|nr:glycosyl transferase group 1 [Pseudonocardiales bacterium]